MKRLLLSAISVMLIMTSHMPRIASAEESSVPLAENAKSAVLIEQDTGQILYEKNIHEKLPPASMTKVMTMLLIMEALDKGTIQLNEKVRTSEHAASMGGSQIFLEEGEEMTVDEMLQGIAIASANDASVAMAERIAGSEEAFIEMMNKRAKELGLKNTKFQNTTGLPADDHYSTAYDMAIMAKELLKYEDITNYTGRYEGYLREDTDNKFWLVNTNRLVKFYPGADGLKTGFTNDAKYCLTATAKKDNMRVIAVVFGAPTSKERNRQITKMFDYAFSQYDVKPIYEKGEIIGETKVIKGEKKSIKAEIKEPLTLLMKKGEKTDDIQQEVVFDKKLTAPIKKGTPIGKVKLTKNGKTISEGSIIAAEDIKTASWWTLFKRTFGDFTRINR